MGGRGVVVGAAHHIEVSAGHMEMELVDYLVGRGDLRRRPDFTRDGRSDHMHLLRSNAVVLFSRGGKDDIVVRGREGGNLTHRNLLMLKRFGHPPAVEVIGDACGGGLYASEPRLHHRQRVRHIKEQLRLLLMQYLLKTVV
jgi:hypothetical protein